METNTHPTKPPANRQPRHVKSIRFTAEEQERLRLLAANWQCTEAAAIRRAVSDAASRVHDEDLRRGAERLREYYATDPDALEWSDFVGDDPASSDIRDGRAADTATPSRSPEIVHRRPNGSPDQAPEGAHGAVAQDEAKEEGKHLPVEP